MKKFYILSSLLIVLLSVLLYNQISAIQSGTLTNRDIKIEKLKGQNLVLPNVVLVEGDSIYLSSIELKGKWEVTKEPAQPWPYEAFQWMKDKNGDNPLKDLSYEGITLDTTWGIADLGGGVGKYTIDKKATQEFKSGAFTNNQLTGFLSADNVYSIEIYAKEGNNQTLVKTLTNDYKNSNYAFSYAKYEVAYKAEGRGVYPANDNKVPDKLVNAKIECKIQFTTGDKGLWFQVPKTATALTFVFKSNGTEFYRIDNPIQIVNPSDLGLKFDVKILTPLPSEGYYKAGDTLDVQLKLTNNNNDELKWWENSLALGLEKFEVLVSGPKNDYEWIFNLRNLVNKYVVGYDSIAQKTYSGNTIKVPIPQTLLNGNGTYTIFVSAKRNYGTTIEYANLTDFQIGTKEISKLPVSSAIEGQSCAKCHGLNGPAKHHGAKGAEQCLPCHTDNFKVGFLDYVHTKHQNNSKINIAIGDCKACHIDLSHNKFTSDADEACRTCHSVIPYMPLDHVNSVPLYSANGMSCATANCHQSGNLGVFKTIEETHANLTQKYVGGTLTAKKVSSPIDISDFSNKVWEKANSIKTLTGIDVKILYDDEYIYVRSEWQDGYKSYSGDVPGSASFSRNMWSFDGTNWTKTGNEDRISFLWSMDDAFGASCAKMCHGTGEGHHTETGKVDNWHWKAQRTYPVDYTDEAYWDGSGRKSDATQTGYFGKDNLSSDGKLPVKMAKDPANNSKPYLPESETTDFDPSKFKAGDKIFGYYYNDGAKPIITGSRADVETKAKFDENTKKWVTIMRRKLNTGNADDAIFDVTKSIQFTVAKFDNTGSGHASQGVDVGVYTLDFSTEVVSVNEFDKSISQIRIAPNPLTYNSRIEFNLNKPSFVTIKMYNLNGGLIGTLVDNKQFETGFQSIPLNSVIKYSGVIFVDIYINNIKYTTKVIN